MSLVKTDSLAAYSCADQIQGMILGVIPLSLFHVESLLRDGLGGYQQKKGIPRKSFDFFLLQISIVTLNFPSRKLFEGSLGTGRYFSCSLFPYSLSLSQAESLSRDGLG